MAACSPLRLLRSGFALLVAGPCSYRTGPCLPVPLRRHMPCLRGPPLCRLRNRTERFPLSKRRSCTRELQECTTSDNAKLCPIMCSVERLLGSTRSSANKGVETRNTPANTRFNRLNGLT